MSIYEHLKAALSALQKEGQSPKVTELATFMRRMFPHHRREITEISNPSRAKATGVKQMEAAEGNSTVWQHPKAAGQGAKVAATPKKPAAGAAEEGKASDTEPAQTLEQESGDEVPGAQDAAELGVAFGIPTEDGVEQHSIEKTLSLPDEKIVELFGELADLKKYLESVGHGVDKRTRLASTVEAFKEYLQTI